MGRWSCFLEVLVSPVESNFAAHSSLVAGHSSGRVEQSFRGLLGLESRRSSVIACPASSRQLGSCHLGHPACPCQLRRFFLSASCRLVAVGFGSADCVEGRRHRSVVDRHPRPRRWVWRPGSANGRSSRLRPRRVPSRARRTRHFFQPCLL